MNQDLDQLYQTYSRKVFLYLLTLSQNRALAEDLTQETFLKASIHSTKTVPFPHGCAPSRRISSMMPCAGRRTPFRLKTTC